MIAAMIKGMTRVCGKHQGYLGLPIRDEHTADGGPMMVTAWTPTPAELEALNRGANVYIKILGTTPPPMKVEVDESQCSDGDVG
jgi:hypothetical protein